jgi:N6-adenosine-specific RNA methylase IME4
VKIRGSLVHAEYEADTYKELWVAESNIYLRYSSEAINLAKNALNAKMGGKQYTILSWQKVY